MSERGRIRDAVRALRGDLAALELPRANELDRAVADLLAAGKAGADIDDDLLELLREDSAARYERLPTPDGTEASTAATSVRIPPTGGPVPSAGTFAGTEWAIVGLLSSARFSLQLDRHNL